MEAKEVRGGRDSFPYHGSPGSLAGANSVARGGSESSEVGESGRPWSGLERNEPRLYLCDTCCTSIYMSAADAAILRNIGHALRLASVVVLLVPWILLEMAVGR